MKKLVHRGQKIVSENGEKYLVIRVTHNSLECLDEKFDLVSIGTSYVCDFYDADDDIDMPNWIVHLLEEGETYKKEGEQE